MVVEELPARFAKHLDEFVQGVRALIGEELKSITLYGSAARGEFDPRASDLNVLLVVEPVEYRHLALLAPHVRKWNRWRIATPLVLSPHYIETSLDVYPIEFLEMQLARNVLWGKDFLQAIEPTRQAIRHQCEREARGKLLHLRGVLLDTGLRPRHLRRAMVLSVPAFLRIGRYVLRLNGASTPLRVPELLEELRKSTPLKLEGVEAAWTIRVGQRKPKNKEIAPLFEAYLADAYAIADFVDTFATE